MLALAGAVGLGAGWGMVGSVEARAAPADDLARCCDAESAAVCPSELLAFGPGSSAHPTDDGVRLFGVWRIPCAGPTRFDAGFTQTVDEGVDGGTVLAGIAPAVAACFDRACALPEGLCLRAEGSRVHVRDCADGSEPTVGMWSNPVRTPFGFGAKPAAPPPPAPTVLASVATPGSTMSAPIPATSRPTAPRPAAPPVAAGSRGPVDTEVPARPPSPCVPGRGMREPSNAQVDAGNDALVHGDPATALDRYRAAISVDRCNAFAWTALGDGLLALGSPLPAKAALEVATTLMPAHFHAWTSLGEALERAGDRAGAAAAYQRALSLRPGHPPALSGLGRVR